MTTDLSSKVACVCDNGLFLPIAHRLAKAFGRVYYFQAWEEGFSTVNKACTGDGYGDVVRAEDLFEIKDQCDLFVFPDIGHSGLQLELEAQGKRVWGSRKGDQIELNRELFLDILDSHGLAVPKHAVIVGITALRDHLRERENVYLKISKYRGMMETTHWRSWQQDCGLLDFYAVKWGPLAELVRFLVFDAIETELEIGGDTYNIVGQWPSKMLHGIEAKDRAYLASVTPRGLMPEALQQVMEAFGPVLARAGYRNEFSMEVRVTDEAAFFTDPTCRGGLPSTASQLMLWKNFPEILWHGADGDLVEPEEAAQFSAECVLSVKGPRKTWVVADIPEAMRDNVKLSGCCRLEGADWFPPDDHEGSEIGWLCAIGDSPKEAVAQILKLAKELPDGVSAATESLADVIKEIEVEEEEGIDFSRLPLPAPSVVVDG